MWRRVAVVWCSLFCFLCGYRGTYSAVSHDMTCASNLSSPPPPFHAGILKKPSDNGNRQATPDSTMLPSPPPEPSPFPSLSTAAHPPSTSTPSSNGAATGGAGSGKEVGGGGALNWLKKSMTTGFSKNQEKVGGSFRGRENVSLSADIIVMPQQPASIHAGGAPFSNHTITPQTTGGISQKSAPSYIYDMKSLKS